ncbi:type IV pilus secretin PilQ [Kangiella koreensis]|uniref:Type IV pilus secretin PilQ n=1 Tax=Kangiella koreensis (strain DSM 16069 / JCM 12317 / KCTC 12182 / SW-125) TaxID=523791 RepID=C7R7W7_KANKD|nr:type IV pilus secretin PilQ [Kangiella koreensis]ACV27650.1 type IV pilus secretin PilQ [Kangiella koreensis DSM 16069]
MNNANHLWTNKSQLGKSTMLTKTTTFIKSCSVFAVAMLVSFGAKASQLESINYNVLPGDKVQLRMTYSDVPPTPQEFTTANPARISMDFEGVDSGLDFKTKDIGVGVVNSVTAIQAQNRTRVVINLSQLVTYNSQIEGSDYVVTLDQGSIATSDSSSRSVSRQTSSGSGYDISGIDFRRGVNGEGRVLVNLGDPNVSVDLRQEGRTVIADFMGADIDPAFVRRLDVIDFGTPAQIVETSTRGNVVRLAIRANDNFEYLAYQANDQYTIELKPLTQQEIEKREREKPTYTGETLTLQFQDMDLKAILHTLGDFAGINIVISDDVQGSMALNLVNVPWDQALDIILKSKGLGKRQEGNVMMIAPADIIAQREQQELEANKQQEELAPLRTELIQVNYAKAAEIAAILQAGLGGGSGDGKSVGILSERGSVTTDQRTNTILVQDVSTKIEDVRRLVAQLDIPVRQVLIEARIVTADDGFARDLGSRFGVSDVMNSGEVNGDFNVNLPIANPAGSLGLSFARLQDGIVVDMELSALESENRGEVVASPKVITANQKEAFIKAGEEIPYLQGASSGAANVQFKEAVLELKVTPQITPDGRVILDLAITQDTRGENVIFTSPDGGGSSGAPAINTQEIGTQVLVDNGETIVLGGIFQHRTTYDESKVPLLGDIPLLGWLFKNTQREDTKQELLIFVTPKIIEQGLKN